MIHTIRVNYNGKICNMQVRDLDKFNKASDNEIIPVWMGKTVWIKKTEIEIIDKLPPDILNEFILSSGI